MLLHRYLRQEQPFLVAVLHQQPVRTHPDLFHIRDPTHRREYADLVLELRQFVLAHRLKARIAQRSVGSHIAHGHIERLDRPRVADAATQSAVLGERDESPPLLVQRLARRRRRSVTFALVHRVLGRFARQRQQFRLLRIRQREGLLSRRPARLHKHIRAVAHHARLVPGHIARVGIMQHPRLGGAHPLGIDHRRHNRRSAAGLPDPLPKVPRHGEVIPLAQRLQRLVVDRLRLRVRVIVREVGTGQHQRLARLLVPLDQLLQRHSQRPARLVTLVAHDDRNQREAAQHLLQPGQLHLQRVLAACRRRLVPTA